MESCQAHCRLWSGRFGGATRWLIAEIQSVTQEPVEEALNSAPAESLPDMGRGFPLFLPGSVSLSPRGRRRQSSLFIWGAELDSGWVRLLDRDAGVNDEPGSLYP